MNPDICINPSFACADALPVAPAPRVFYAPVLPSVQAGFPSPAGDYMESAIDLNEHLIEHPSSTFFMRVHGESMIGAHIPPGALLVVDRSLKPVHGSIVIAVIDGEFTCKRIEARGTTKQLVSENPKFRPIIITEGMRLDVWGVVRAIIIDAKTV
jgi:DNA polymerase V